VVEAARGMDRTPYGHQAAQQGAGLRLPGLLRGVWLRSSGKVPEAILPIRWIVRAAGRGALVAGRIALTCRPKSPDR